MPATTTITQLSPCGQEGHTFSKAQFHYLSKDDAQHAYDSHVERRTKRYIEQRLLHDSVFFDENKCHKVPRFFREELRLGKDELGKGEFGVVYEILSFQRSPALPDDNEDETSSSSSSYSHSWPTSSLVVSPTSGSTKEGTAGSIQTSTLTVPACYGFFVDPTVSSLDDEDQDDFGYNTNSNTDDQSCMEEPRHHLIRNAIRNGQPRYALKFVRNDLKDWKACMAATDLACEAKFLSALCHPNVIKLRGIVGYAGRPHNFGIILDRLSCTLQDKIDQWAKSRHYHRVSLRWMPQPNLLFRTLLSPWCQLCKRNMRTSPFSDRLFEQRVLAVYDVARAMKYLHSKRIVFRDLKPENVGVNLRGDFVIFDFGLSKELKEVDRIVGEDPDLYEATVMTGSRKYMSPEVATCRPYGFSADVFSFAMLFWEVMSLEEAFPHMGLNKHYEQVILGHKRPKSLSHMLPKSLNDMMEHAWSGDPKERPTFQDICEIIHEAAARRNFLVSIDRSQVLREASLESYLDKIGSLGI